MVVGGRKRLEYGVVGSEVDDWANNDDFVREFLTKYKTHPLSMKAYANNLFIFFRWLRMKRDLKVSGEELVELHIKHKASPKLQDRRWALRLALDFSRDNVDFADCSDRRKYHLFSLVKHFFDCYEAPLTTDNNPFGRVAKRKYRPKQMSVDQARTLLGNFNIRDRSILLCMLQSGMAIGDVLNKFNFMLPQLKTTLQDKAERFKIEIDERKGNNFPYFTFISRDALHELNKWLAVRETWIGELKDPGCIFIARPIALKNQAKCEEVRPLTVLSFEVNYIRVVRRLKLKDSPWSMTPHMFRKLFKTESRAPERGVDQDIVEFMMGHSSGIQAVGGVYDKTPELHSEIVEKEYAKLEPYLNVYTGRPGDSQFTDKERKVLDLLSDPEVFKELEDMLKKRKDKI